jgi:GNAT superfamily N-acetyltransferase
MRIELLDPADATSVTEVVELWRGAFEADFPDDPPFCPTWERARIDHPLPDEPSEFWLARDGDDLVGVLDLALPRMDNLTTGLLEIVVRPSARRRGVATALYRSARARLAELSRKLLVLMTPLDAPGAAFAEAVGAEPGLVEVRRRLVIEEGSLPLWLGLLADAVQRAAGYTVVRWVGDTPDEHLDDIAYLTGRMSTDAPMDDLSWEPEAYDAQRIRDREAALAPRGRRIYTTAVVHEESGRLVGFTELCFDPCNRGNAWQWNTLVDPQHRGHRLGTVLKVENLLFTRAHEPELRTVYTWNAASNAHMIAINEAMGFRAVDGWCEWQLRLT